ncbi:MAG: HlyD family efflux transporter periplasmic adaptor subunit [Gallionellaceae bacterium]|jgi:HlyD family secretion protein|nr:HlyD family efflux transporter periplasmic adaptor subunit [Gallionellaceae bacterium]
MLNKKRTPLLVIALLIVVALWAWKNSKPAGPGEGFVSGNGRIEATEVDVAGRLGGRVEEILVYEGDFVKAGQVLVRMQIDTLNAQLREAQAQVTARQSDLAAVQAQVIQRESELDAAKRRQARSETLAQEGASSMQELDDDRARARNAQAAVDAARAQVAAAQAAVKAASATVERINADLVDSDLKAPRDGRIQFRLAQPGEVVGAGGKVLNLVDLSDVYMTFFVPESVAGRIAMGTEVRIVLDVAPKTAIPARVSFVADTAQFTPKTVETASERQKLMFRVRARIDEALLKSRLDQVKTGLPGVAWIRLDDKQPWPPELSQMVQVK